MDNDLMEQILRDKIIISDEEFYALTGALKQRYGIDFTNYEIKSLKRGFARLIAKHDMKNLLGLWSKILKDREFMIGCIDDLTVNLTELFRNPDIWIKLRDDVMKNYTTRSAIKMWHAGCSTGEEVYTMAFVLYYAKLLHKTTTLGTDLSATALGTAVSGTYPKMLYKKYIESFNKFLPDVKAGDFFLVNEETISVKEQFKSHVRFDRHNLVQDPIQGKFDIIFCRNVMIYFDEVLKMKVLNLFHSALEDDGLLIIGYYDMLPEKHKELFTLYDPTTRIYKKINNPKAPEQL